jgi:hypothetical protein
MRQLRSFVLAAVAVALFTAPPAGARPLDRERPAAIFTPVEPAWLAESAAQIDSLPASQNPFAGNGNPCLTVGRGVVQEIGNGPCRIEDGWTVMLGFGSGWISAQDPFPQTRAQQCALTQAADRATFAAAQLTVDGTATVNLYTSRFELCSPQVTLLLPEDNIDDLPGPQIVTETAHGWFAAVRHLRPGRHTIVANATLADGTPFTVPSTVIVVPRHAADSDSEDQPGR